MTHEIKQLFDVIKSWQKVGKKTVLVTVVALDGTSYRRPGVRMLVNDLREVFGAVSGGCVEKEIVRQAQHVLETGIPRIMTYDGRLRLGCEGILYMLIEPVFLSEELIKVFQDVLKKRISFAMESFYKKEASSDPKFGSQLLLEGQRYSLYPDYHPEEQISLSCFSQEFPPLFQLYIFGAEHDAVEVCKSAHQLGWEITIIAGPDEEKTLAYFPGASRLLTPDVDAVDMSGIDTQTAVLFMTHSFNKDIRYLLALKDCYPAYFGILGSAHRRERILSKFLEYHPDIPTEFLEQLHAPAGLNIGAESPAEIAVSITAEILSTIRKQEPIPLRDKAGTIHG